MTTEWFIGWDFLAPGEDLAQCILSNKDNKMFKIVINLGALECKQHWKIFLGGACHTTFPVLNLDFFPYGFAWSFLSGTNLECLYGLEARGQVLSSCLKQ